MTLEPICRHPSHPSPPPGQNHPQCRHPSHPSAAGKITLLLMDLPCSTPAQQWTLEPAACRRCRCSKSAGSPPAAMPAVPTLVGH
ncbi:MAG: hypothetical protein KME26_33750 [Oscillatoria princeps RMCB-10]|nr:hypothetical protein [Oscillatoria princeps RMCB-10]